jgi:glycosyltransferase involved in cell wall biosynthesis
MLEGCLDSVLGQDFAGFEVIVVDGGSTDGTLAHLVSRGAKVRTIHEQGGGPGGARNVGVEAAAGRFVVFVDSDDLLLPGALTLYAKVLCEVTDARMVLAAFRDFSNEDELRTTTGPALEWRRYDDYLDAATASHLSGTHRLIIDRAAFRSAGGLRPQLRVCEDQDFGLRSCELGSCVAILSPPTVGYRHHPGNISSSRPDFSKGVRWMIDAEKSGGYPGGARRRAQRRAVISRSARSVSVACLTDGNVRDGMGLYTATLAWHLRQRRLKYVCGFPLKAAVRCLSRS